MLKNDVERCDKGLSFLPTYWTSCCSSFSNMWQKRQTCHISKVSDHVLYYMNYLSKYYPYCTQAQGVPMHECWNYVFCKKCVK